MSVLQLIIVAAQWGDEKSHSAIDDVSFGFQLAACVVGILNPIKFLGPPGVVLVSVLDVVMGLALGILQVVEGFVPQNSPTALPTGALAGMRAP